MQSLVFRLLSSLSLSAKSQIQACPGSTSKSLILTIGRPGTRYLVTTISPRWLPSSLMDSVKIRFSSVTTQKLPLNHTTKEIPVLDPITLVISPRIFSLQEWAEFSYMPIPDSLLPSISHLPVCLSFPPETAAEVMSVAFCLRKECLSPTTTSHLPLFLLANPPLSFRAHMRSGSSMLPKEIAFLEAPEPERK